MGRRGRAYTLIEMISTAVVTIVVVAAAFYYIVKNRDVAQDRQAASQLTTIVDPIRDYYRHVPRDTRYATLNTGIINAQDLLSDSIFPVNRFGRFTDATGTTRCPAGYIPGCATVGTDDSWFAFTLTITREPKWRTCDTYIESMKKTNPKRLVIEYSGSVYTYEVYGSNLLSGMDCVGNAALTAFRNSNSGYSGFDLEVTLEWE